jgi:hypothetical protein
VLISLYLYMYESPLKTGYILININTMREIFSSTLILYARVNLLFLYLLQPVAIKYRLNY